MGGADGAARGSVATTPLTPGRRMVLARPQAGFVGYCVQANGIKFPWEPFASITATSPPDQWDALPEAAKIQIILGVGFLEWWSELRLEEGSSHYMKGGKPGYVPPFDATPDQLPHWIGLNLW